MKEFSFNDLPNAVAQLLEEVSQIRQMLTENGNSRTTEGDKLLSIQEASTLLHLTVPTIYGLVHRREIPVCKKGKRLYFSKDELTTWIKGGRQKTATELSAEAIELSKKQNK